MLLARLAWRHVRIAVFDAIDDAEGAPLVAGWQVGKHPLRRRMWSRVGPDNVVTVTGVELAAIIHTTHRGFDAQIAAPCAGTVEVAGHPVEGAAHTRGGGAAVLRVSDSSQLAFPAWRCIVAHSRVSITSKQASAAGNDAVLIWLGATGKIRPWLWFGVWYRNFTSARSPSQTTSLSTTRFTFRG